MGTVHNLKHPQGDVEFVRDLKGRHPLGHPEVRRGKRGGVLLDVGQVWVEIHSDKLWVLIGFAQRDRSGTYKHDVTIRPYHKQWSHVERNFSEQNFRGSFKVWEDFLVFRDESFARLLQGAAEHGMDREAACRFFGLDPETGNRLE